MSMISHEISWWDISVVQVIQVIQVMQLIQVMQVRLAHLWPDFRVICTKKCTLFPNGDPSNVILLFVRWLKTEIVKKKLRNICMTHVPVENKWYCIYISTKVKMPIANIWCWEMHLASNHFPAETFVASARLILQPLSLSLSLSTKLYFQCHCKHNYHLHLSFRGYCILFQPNLLRPSTSRSMFLQWPQIDYSSH